MPRIARSVFGNMSSTVHFDQTERTAECVDLVHGKRDVPSDARTMHGLGMCTRESNGGIPDPNNEINILWIWAFWRQNLASNSLCLMALVCSEQRIAEREKLQVGVSS